MIAPSSTPHARSLWYFVAGGGLACLVALALLDVRLLALGVPGQWEWQWRSLNFVASPHIVLALLAYLLLALYVGHLLDRPRLRRRVIAGAVALSCVAAALALGLLMADETLPAVNLAATTASAPASGYFSYATSVTNVRSLLRGFPCPPEDITGMPGRVATHPPGPLLAYLFGLRALTRFPGPAEAVKAYLSAHYCLTPQMLYQICRPYIMPTVTPEDLPKAIILGALLTLLACLLPLPAYFIGRECGGPREGLLAAFLVVLVPSLLVFYPSIDGVAALLALVAIALWLSALRGGRLWQYALVGLAMAAAVFWTAGLLACALVMLVVALVKLHVASGQALKVVLKNACGRALQSPKAPWLASVGLWRALPPSIHRASGVCEHDLNCKAGPLWGMAMAVGVFAALYAALYLACGYSLPGNLHVVAFAQHHEMVYANRDYLTWLPFNLYDFILFAGPLLFALGLYGLVTSRGLPTVARGYAWGVGATFAVIWLSGSTLGEVGRIWLFLMALWALIPVGPVAQLPARPRRWLLVALAVAQIALTLAMHLNLSLVRP